MIKSIIITFLPTVSTISDQVMSFKFMDNSNVVTLHISEEGLQSGQWLVKPMFTPEVIEKYYSEDSLLS